MQTSFRDTPPSLVPRRGGANKRGRVFRACVSHRWRQDFSTNRRGRGRGQGEAKDGNDGVCGNGTTAAPGGRFESEQEASVSVAMEGIARALSENGTGGGGLFPPFSPFPLPLLKAVSKAAVS